jgi:formylglycine-generating enzyme required for sulfatase activity
MLQIIIGSSCRLTALRYLVLFHLSMLRALLFLLVLSVVTFPLRGAPDGESFAIADLELVMIYVEAGTFMMGSPAEEALRDKAEGPQTKVSLTHPFWLGKTEVTQAQYDVGPQAPVEEVSWDDCMKYCEVLTERERAAKRLPEGYEYTLPTEAQWEYACRAGTTSDYAGNPSNMAWSNGNSRGTTHPVAQLRPNQWGFYDMSGNILEWCSDWYGKYSGGSVTDPKGPKRGYFRMARGGSWRMDSGVGRSAARAGGSQGRRDYTIGFRLALCKVEN